VPESLFAVSDPDGSHAVVVTAESADAAAEAAVRRRSVGEIERGLILAVWRLGRYPEQFHVAYDGPPMNDNHTSTGAQKVVRSLGRPRV
jgi:hypothetical protein